MPKAFKPILDINTTSNTYGLDKNCYYCTVAALRNQTVEQFFKDCEIMQDDFATLDDIINLFAEGGMDNIAYRAYNEGGNFYNQVILNMPRGCGLGLAYTRKNTKSGHMVVLAKDNNGIVKCVDYQQNPPTIADFPPEPNIEKVYVFYIDKD